MSHDQLDANLTTPGPAGGSADQFRVIVVDVQPMGEQPAFTRVFGTVG